MRNAQIKMIVDHILADPDKVTRMGWTAKEGMLEGEALSQKLVEVLENSPAIPLEINEFFLVGILAEALKWKADKLSFLSEPDGYEVFFYRRTPTWMR